MRTRSHCALYCVRCASRMVLPAHSPIAGQSQPLPGHLRRDSIFNQLVAPAVPTPFSLFINPSCVIGGFLTSFLPFWLSLQSPFNPHFCLGYVVCSPQRREDHLRNCPYHHTVKPNLGSGNPEACLDNSARHYDACALTACDLIPVDSSSEHHPSTSLPRLSCSFAPVPVSTPREQRCSLFD